MDQFGICSYMLFVLNFKATFNRNQKMLRNQTPDSFLTFFSKKREQLYWDNSHTKNSPVKVFNLLLLFSCSDMSNSLQPHGLQHTRLPCPSPSSGVCSNPCPLSRWCHPTISSSVVPLSSCLQSFPASGSFPVSQLFISDGLSIGASVSVLPINIQGWFPLGLTGLISLLSKGLSRVFSSIIAQRHQFFSAQPFLLSSSHIPTWLLEKP